jgi:hypothetical protein
MCFCLTTTAAEIFGEDPATAWLDAFAEALAAHDSGRIAALFRPDGS